MRFPKLRQTVLCQLLLYFPAFAIILMPVLLAALPIAGVKLPDWVIAALLLFTDGLSLWYLYRNYPFLLYSDVHFAAIRSWKTDRLVYRSGINGADRQSVERAVLRRARRWGRRAESPEGGSLVGLFYRHSVSWTVFYSVIEKRAAVYSTTFLDTEGLRSILRHANARFHDIPDGRPILRTRQERKAPPCRAALVIILADELADDVRKDVRNKWTLSGFDAVVPCVAECRAGQYYLDGRREYYELGVMGRPARNFAAAMARRILFGGRLPEEDRQSQPPSALASDLDTSLWQFFRSFRGEMRQGLAAAAKESGRMLKKLADGEICMGKYAIYCRQGDRLAVCDYLLEEGDEPLLSLLLENRWELPRSHPFIARKSAMKKAERAATARRIENWLQINGYRFHWEE